MTEARRFIATADVCKLQDLSWEICLFRRTSLYLVLVSVHGPLTTFSTPQIADCASLISHYISLLSTYSALRFPTIRRSFPNVEHERHAPSPRAGSHRDSHAGLISNQLNHQQRTVGKTDFKVVQPKFDRTKTRPPTVVGIKCHRTGKIGKIVGSCWEFLFPNGVRNLSSGWKS